jgi:hypothetical protein
MPDEPLASWNDTPTRAAILDLVERVTTGGGPDFVPAAERIATFDNDGTLWCEKPLPRHYAGDDSLVKVLLGGILRAFGGMTVDDCVGQSGRS